MTTTLKTRTPALYLDFTLEPGASVTQPILPGWNAFIYVFGGKAEIQGVAIETFHAGVLDTHGDRVTISNPTVGGGGGRGGGGEGEVTRFLLLAGEPIGEPVVQYGPFVMNTMEEIKETFEDLRSGKNGFEKAPAWKSKAGIH